jgi:RNA polymerase sigma-32 factor
MDWPGDLDLEDFEDDAAYGGDGDLYDPRLPVEAGDPGGRFPAPREPGRVPSGPVGQGSLGSYLSDLKHFKVLSKKEEAELFRRYAAGDQDAGRRLVTGNLRLVVKIAMEYQTHWLQNIQDLIQEGNIGLLQALKKFDPSRGVRFGYYAIHWIKACILKFILDNWRMVRVGTTQAQRKLFYNLRKEQDKIAREGLEPGPELLAERLGVSPREVEEMATRIKSGNEISLDTPMAPDGEEAQVSIIQSMEDPTDKILADRQIRELVAGKLRPFRKTLDERENFILDRRLMSDEPLTLQELGEEFGVTRERVRQLVERLKKKLHAYLVKEIPNLDLMG